MAAPFCIIITLILLVSVNVGNHSVRGALLKHTHSYQRFARRGIEHLASEGLGTLGKKTHVQEEHDTTDKHQSHAFQ